MLINGNRLNGHAHHEPQPASPRHLRAMLLRTLADLLEHLPAGEVEETVEAGGVRLTLTSGHRKGQASGQLDQDLLWLPTPYQRAILQALEGRALRTDALAAEVGDRSRLFRHRGGLPELRERGLVAHHPRRGYYRPDAPPEEMHLR